MPRGYPGSTPGVDFRSQGVISRRFKQKKIFVTNVRTDAWTDRRDGGNSGLDFCNPIVKLEEITQFPSFFT